MAENLGTYVCPKTGRIIKRRKRVVGMRKYNGGYGPKPKDGATISCAVRIGETLNARLDAYCAKHNMPKSTAIKNILDLYLPPAPLPAPPAPLPAPSAPSSCA